MKNAALLLPFHLDSKSRGVRSQDCSENSMYQCDRQRKESSVLAYEHTTGNAHGSDVTIGHVVSRRRALKSDSRDSEIATAMCVMDVAISST